MTNPITGEPDSVEKIKALREQQQRVGSTGEPGHTSLFSPRPTPSEPVPLSPPRESVSEPKALTGEDAPAPQATTIFTVTATCFSKGNSAASFRAPDARVFMTPDSAVVITGMFPGYFDQFTVGQTYTISVGTP